MRDPVVCARVPRETKEALARAAKASGVELGTYVAEVLQDAVRRGVDPAGIAARHKALRAEAQRWRKKLLKALSSATAELADD